MSLRLASFRDEQLSNNFTGNNGYAPTFGINNVPVAFSKATIDTPPNILTNSGAMWSAGRGRLNISVVNAIPFYFSFAIDGGRSSLNSDPARMWTLVGSTTIPSTNLASLSSVNDANGSITVTAVTDAADGGGRTYIFNFSSAVGVPYTVYCTTGAAAGDTTIFSKWYS